MTILITGPDTIFGYHVARAAAQSGATVRALASPFHPIEIDGVAMVSSSAAILDLESCMTTMAGVTSVVHCVPERLLEAPDDSAAGRADVEGTRNLLLAMSRMGVEDIYFASTALLIDTGTMEEPSDESAPPAPSVLPCLESIRASMNLVGRYRDDGSIKPVFFYPTLLFSSPGGPRGQSGWFLDHAEEVSRIRGGVNVASAADAGLAAVRALGRAAPGDSYILGGENVTCDRLAAAIKAAGGSGREVKRGGKGIFGRKHGKGTAPATARLAAKGLYYDPALARTKLDLHVADPDDLVRSSLAAAG